MAKKKRQPKYIGPGMSDISKEEETKKKGKKRMKKPKMPARIKKDQTHRR